MCQSNILCSVGFDIHILSNFTANTSYIPLIFRSAGEVLKPGEQHIEYICGWKPIWNSGFAGICSFYSFTTSWCLSVQSMCISIDTITHMISIRRHQISDLLHALFILWGVEAFRNDLWSHFFVTFAKVLLSKYYTPPTPQKTTYLKMFITLALMLAS